MDTDRFDTLARSLMDARSRRGALAALLGGTLGLLGLAETLAKKKKKGKKKKRGKGANPSPPAPTCTDGVKNGSESDIDCGGSCPRCAIGKNCGSRNDCAGALCFGGTCQAPLTDCDCGRDSRGACYKGEPWTGGPLVCTTASATGPKVNSCTSCPTGTICFEASPSGTGVFSCFKPCDAP